MSQLIWWLGKNWASFFCLIFSRNQALIDHQTRNYKSLKKQNAIICVTDEKKSFSVVPSGYSPDNLHGVVVLLVVDAHDKHGSISTGGRDHHPLGAALQVSLQSHTSVEETTKVRTITKWKQKGWNVRMAVRKGRRLTEAFSMVVNTPVDSTT